MRLQLSVVLPAYDEAHRLPPYLSSVREYLGSVFENYHEVIVVDDGSRDDLLGLLGGLTSHWPQLSLIRHTCNLGKGAALCTGVRAAKGDLVLIADADGATPITEEHHLRRAIEQGADVAIGSRLLPASSVSRNRRRGLTGRCFAWVVHLLYGDWLIVHDTQCGFKMFRRETALELFRLCRETGYLIDVEVLVHAQRLGFRIAEVPVSWTDIPGSKVRLWYDGLKMLCGLWRLRRALQAPAERRQEAPGKSPMAELQSSISWQSSTPSL